MKNLENRNVKQKKEENGSDISLTHSNFSIDETIYYYPEDFDVIENELRKSPRRYSKKIGIEKAPLYYYNVPAAFDIEDSSFRIHEEGETKEESKNGGVKFSTMYVWQFAINGKCIIGRTWDEFLEFIGRLNYYTDYYHRLIIYVHYLNHEFSFIRKYFIWREVFCKAERSPIYAVTKEGIEFRDSYILTAKSLEKSAEDLHTYKISKMVGDLDYDLIRGTETQLTEKELGYCAHDVLVLNAIIQEKIEQEPRKSICEVPLTNTGYVRRYMRGLCFDEKKKSDTKKYRALMKQLTMTSHDYDVYKRAFAGGFTHANALYVGDKIEGVIDSDDFTSSYPAVILSEKFPMSKPKIYDSITPENFQKILTDPTKLSIFDITFNNLQMRSGVYENPLSVSKCWISDDVMSNNGRVVKASKVSVTITNIDLSYLRVFYTCDSIQVGEVYVWDSQYLPKPIIEGVLKFYEQKTTLKEVEGKEVEYQVFKGMLNSVYGCMVTDPLKDLITYEDNEWGINHIKDDEQRKAEAIEKYNESKKRFLYYPWGIFITAYARNNLFTAIYELGIDYIYSDTDSVKYVNRGKHVEYFRKYNYNIVNKINECLNFHGIDPEKSAPKNKKGDKKQIGVWDWETENKPYTTFKTLGAKRYMYVQKGELHITIAGLSKSEGLKYIKKQKDPFDFFNDEMTIDAEHSGRLTHTYIDVPEDGEITDYLGNKMKFHEACSVHLEKSEFTLSILKQFENYVKGYKDAIYNY